MGIIDTTKPVAKKSATNFLLRDLDNVGSPFMRAAREVTQQEEARQNDITAMRPARPQRVQVTPVAGSADLHQRGTNGQNGGSQGATGLADIKAPQILSPHEWARQTHPDLAMKAKLPGHLIDQLDKEYANYVATQRAVGQLALGGAQENRLRFVARERAAAGRKPKEKPLEQRLKEAALAERIQNKGREGPIGKLYREWQQSLRAPQAPQRQPGRFVQEQMRGDPAEMAEFVAGMTPAERKKLEASGGVASLGMGGALSRITSPATWLEEQRRLTGAGLRFMGSESDQKLVIEALRDKAREVLPQANLDFSAGRITEEEVLLIRSFAGAPPFQGK